LCPPSDPLIDQALRLLVELRERADEPLPTEPAEELLAGGYVSALALERAQRRLRERAAALAADVAPGAASPPELSRVAQLELRLAAQERELRQLLGTFRARRTTSDDAGPAAAAQVTKPRRSA
jgi:hypothetical protein